MPAPQGFPMWVNRLTGLASEHQGIQTRSQESPSLVARLLRIGGAKGNTGFERRSCSVFWLAKNN
ncbi:MAG: hypothetical protein ACI87E_001879 [Mariniblastus sp.]